jgi:GT2 family glycosyltransferase
MKPVSIIMVAWDNNIYQRNVTLAALACIRKYTEGEYELIMVDCGSYREGGYKHQNWTLIKPDIYIEPEKDPGFSAAMNLGVSKSKYDVIVCMHNDVLVHEGWSPALQGQIELRPNHLIYPDQQPRTREQMESFYNDPDRHNREGYDDAGMFMTTREVYDKLGGYDEEFGRQTQEWALHTRAHKRGVGVWCTVDTFITHISYTSYTAEETATEADQDKRLREKYK